MILEFSYLFRKLFGHIKHFSPFIYKIKILAIKIKINLKLTYFATKKKQIVKLDQKEPKNWHNYSNPTIQSKLCIFNVNKTKNKK